MALCIIPFDFGPDLDRKIIQNLYCFQGLIVSVLSFHELNVINIAGPHHSFCYYCYLSLSHGETSFCWLPSISTLFPTYRCHSVLKFHLFFSDKFSLAFHRCCGLSEGGLFLLPTYLSLLSSLPLIYIYKLHFTKFLWWISATNKDLCSFHSMSMPSPYLSFSCPAVRPFYIHNYPKSIA